MEFLNTITCQVSNSRYSFDIHYDQHEFSLFPWELSMHITMHKMLRKLVQNSGAKTGWRLENHSSCRLDHDAMKDVNREGEKGRKKWGRREGWPTRSPNWHASQIFTIGAYQWIPLIEYWNGNDQGDCTHLLREESRATSLWVVYTIHNNSQIFVGSKPSKDLCGRI